jgi:LPS-assembly protein
LFYLYIPNEDQSDLPIFDTGLFDFSFDSLFRENRFSGNDRLGDANQVTLAITSHLINQQSGKNFGHVSLGQIFYMRDRKVNLPNNGVRDEDSSAIIAEISTRIIKNWVFGGDVQWDPNIGNGTEKITAHATYNPMPGKVLNLAYRVRRDTTDIEQSDISFRWPFDRNWSAVGRWNYAVPEGRSLELFGGIEYDSCCWALRAVGRRFLTDINGVFDTGIFLQLELKGLAGVGKKTVNFLKEQIPGYQSEF